MKIIEWDKNGYPTEESLKKLENTLADGHVGEAIKAFFAALKENLYNACGPAKIEVRGQVIDVWEYHTYGWSGNESIIRVLESNVLWALYLQRHDRGGHYYFSCPPTGIKTSVNKMSVKRDLNKDKGWLYAIERAQKAEALLKEILPMAMWESCMYYEHESANPSTHCCYWNAVVEQIQKVLGGD